MILLQLSAGQGPEECALAVAKALRRLLHGSRGGTGRGACAGRGGWHAARHPALLCCSPCRASGPRRWPLPGAARCNGSAPVPTGQVMGARTGSSAARCLHRRRPAWKARSASRRCARPVPVASMSTPPTRRCAPLHLASGISVKVQSERSQHANRRLALLLIARRLAERAEEADERLRAERRLRHQQLERGNPRRTFRGERFVE